jgi:tryptophanyl-tRNA synthetase
LTTAVGAGIDIATLVPVQGKVIYQAAEKWSDTVSEEARAMLIKYLFTVAEEDKLGAVAVKVNAALAFLGAAAAGAIDEETFRAAAGVGVTVSKEEVNAAVAALVKEHEADIKKNGHRYDNKLKGLARGHPALKFAELADVEEAIAAEFLSLLGEKTEENTKKTKKVLQSKKEVSGKGGGGGGGAAVGGVAGAAEPNAAAAAADDAASLLERRTLLTKIALDHDLDVGKILKQYMPGGEDNADHEQTVNPVDVETDGEAIDYEKLIRDFGTERISPELIARFEKITGKRAHHLLRRGIFFSHRDLGLCLDAYEAGKPFYLYTGRGPSSESMHLGHLIPFFFTKYLQDAFGCNLVIQMTDDEKYLWKDLTLEQLAHTLKENVRDIIAYGFDREKTFIFSDFEYMGGKFYENVVMMQKRMTGNQCMKALGVSTLDNIGKFSWSAIQAAPSFSSSFPHMFGADSNNFCLIPCAIDQDVYFRITRGIAPRLGLEKPAVIHSSFLPAMGGPSSKMSSSTGQEKTIFLTDTAADIKMKVNKYAFSAGGATLAEHKLHGGNLDMDVSYQYLRFFMADDVELERIGSLYSKGEIGAGDVKAALIETLQVIVAEHQGLRAGVTDEEIRYFMSADPARFGR